MKKKLSILKNPLFLFVFFGTLLYIGYAFTLKNIVQKNTTITVDAMQFEVQKELFIKTWNRNPNQEELMGQIDNWVMDEIFYREAVALGLDKTDLAIKRRLRQMLELMMEDYTTVTPNENQLRTFLNENPEKFVTDPKLSFQHIYFKQNEKGAAEALLQKIKENKVQVSDHLGKFNMIPDEFVLESAQEISRFLGYAFTQKLIDVETEEWFGPISSPYGYHLVKISEKQIGELPDLNEIWTEVEREWSAQQKIALKDAHYRKLKEKYIIVYEDQE